MEGTNENNICVKNAITQDKVFIHQEASPCVGVDVEERAAGHSSQGQKCKTPSERSNGCSRLMTSSSEEEDFCDCDACLLGFDDTRPGEVLEHPRRKRTPVKDTFLSQSGVV